MQKAEVFWTCACGSKVRAILDMTEASATVRCPNSSCKVTRTLPGQITELSVETAPGVWIREWMRPAYFLADQR